jgi:hypothetical protein
MRFEREEDRRQRLGKERWVHVPGFEDVKVSNWGKVHSVATCSPVSGKHRTRRGGHVDVGGQWVRRAWLVAVCFVPNPNPDELTQVCFRVDNGDCHADNLMWIKPQRIDVVPPQNAQN